jgi:hypothetical protein
MQSPEKDGPTIVILIDLAEPKELVNIVYAILPEDYILYQVSPDGTSDFILDPSSYLNICSPVTLYLVRNLDLYQDLKENIHKFQIQEELDAEAQCESEINRLTEKIKRLQDGLQGEIQKLQISLKRLKKLSLEDQPLIYGWDLTEFLDQAV